MDSSGWFAYPFGSGMLNASLLKMERHKINWLPKLKGYRHREDDRSISEILVERGTAMTTGLVPTAIANSFAVISQTLGRMMGREKKVNPIHGSKHRIVLASSVVGLAILLGNSIPARADAIIYQNLPTTLATPPEISFHNANGPIIADDFVPIASGRVTTVTWWGSLAPSTSWELVLQNNNPALGQPALTPPGNIFSGGVKALGVVAAGVPFAPLPGVFQFTADFSNFAIFNVNAGTDYWITIANFAPGWNWAEALGGPSIGSENFNAQTSTRSPLVGVCQDGGPHCGPWTNIHTDFAVRISAVPEPMSLVLLVAGLGLAAVRRRKTHVG